MKYNQQAHGKQNPQQVFLFLKSIHMLLLAYRISHLSLKFMYSSIALRCTFSGIFHGSESLSHSLDVSLIISFCLHQFLNLIQMYPTEF